MPNFADPLWGEEPWGGPLGPSTANPFPPSDDERGNLDIDQIRASVKSGGKSVPASQLVTTVNPGPDGGGGMWQGGNWVSNNAPAVAVPPPGATPILDRATGIPIADRATGEWIFAR